MLKLERFNLITCTFVLVSMSIVLPAYHWIFLTDNTTTSVLLALAIVALGLCKILFFSQGFELIKNNNKVIGLLLLTFALLLLFLSVIYTKDLLQNVFNESAQKQLKNSIEFTTLNSQLKSLDAQINNYNNLISTDSKNSYRKRSYEGALQVSKLEKQRSILLVDLKALLNASKNTPHASLNLNPIKSNGQAANAYTALSLVAATCLHLGAVLSVLALNTTVSKKQLKKDIPSKPLTTQPDKKPADISDKKPKKQTLSKEELQKFICQGKMDEQINVRNLVPMIKGGHKTVKLIIEEMTTEGLVEQRANRYFLTENSQQTDWLK